jgi:hypothetical protein
MNKGGLVKGFTVSERIKTPFVESVFHYPLERIPLARANIEHTLDTLLVFFLFLVV